MTKIEIDLHEDVVSIINKLKNINDTGIEVVVPEGAVFFENVLNIKVLKKWADREGKVVNFTTDDDNGLNLLASLDEENLRLPTDVDDLESEELVEEKLPQKRVRRIPKIKIKGPKLQQGGGKKFIFLGLLTALLLILGFYGIKYVIALPNAEVKVVVNSQPLARSIQIRVSSTEETSINDKILRGYTINASVEDKVTTPTTGEKIIGEKAEGEITIFNNTDEEKKFKKGKEVIFNVDGGDDLRYILKNDVTVPAREIKNEVEGEEITYVYGKAKAEVEAKEIGKDYNIDKGEDLQIDDEDKKEFKAETEEDIDGGKEESIMIVSQDDLDKLKKDLLENAEEKTLKALEEAIDKDKKFIVGSENLTVSQEKYSHELGDEVKEVALEQTFSASGLVYDPDGLNKMIDEMVKEFIPQGFVLSSKERTVNVEILGDTESTTVTNTGADLQVTLKTFVVPEISEESIKEQLYGLSIADAQKAIGSIRNIKTYELALSPRIPFLDFIPRDANRVHVKIERE